MADRIITWRWILGNCRFAVFIVVKIQVEVFWTVCCVVLQQDNMF
jgi:hypothetical protein